jgi:steroid delta-isomerase-like uncharacterized protein
MAETGAATTDAATLMAESFAAIAARDLEALMNYWHDDLVEDFVVLGPITGKEAAAAFFREMFTAVPDLKFTATRIMAISQTTAVGEWTLDGTLSGGPFLGVEPNGRRVLLRGIDVMECEDGLLIHNTIYYDGMSFARQIGLLPMAGSRTDRAMLASFNALTNVVGRFRRPREERGR